MHFDIDFQRRGANAVSVDVRITPPFFKSNRWSSKDVAGNVSLAELKKTVVQKVGFKDRAAGGAAELFFVGVGPDFEEGPLEETLAVYGAFPSFTFCMNIHLQWRPDPE